VCGRNLTETGISLCDWTDAWNVVRLSLIFLLSGVESYLPQMFVAPTGRR
jgi:hypothetical protein